MGQSQSINTAPEAWKGPVRQASYHIDCGASQRAKGCLVLIVLME